MTETEHWLRAGVVGRPHGLDGSFHVADAVAALLEMGTEVRLGDVRRAIVRLAGHDGRPIVRLEGCEDRGAAEALRGQELLVARSEAPALDEDEWWAADLEGCAVRDGEREVGVVARLLALPSCEVLEVARTGDTPDLLVPLVRDAVRDVDLDGRVIDIDLEFLGEA
ncbi:MAG TPA: ribosome maturation factor RimM [Solirubrobacteraceae bacterium]|nr:ribosome maturation factor RimM [Solirubrobacteraceae bacterium]